MEPIELKIWMALKSRISLSIPVAMPMDQIKIDPSGELAIVSYIPNISERISLGNDETHDYRGILQISFLAPLEWNQEQIINSASEAVGLFLEGDYITYEGVRVRIVKRGDIGQTYRDGGHWRTPVSFSYQALA